MVPNTIKLTDRQLEEMKKDLKKRKVMNEMLTRLFESIADRIAEDEEEFWKQVYSIAGVDQKDYLIKVCWISGELKIEKYSEIDTEGFHRHGR